LSTARPTGKIQFSKLHNSLYNKDFYTASKFNIKFFRLPFFFGHPPRGYEKPENSEIASNIKEAHVRGYSVTTQEKNAV
jgi:hypothetical protein